MSHKPAFVYYS